MSASYHEHIFDSYINEYPEVLSRIDHWAKHNSNSIMIFYKDGSRGIYHMMMKGLRSARRDDGSEAELRRHFRDELVEWMYDRGYTQQTLAKAAGISQRAMSKYLNKEAMPSGYVIYKLAKALKCTPNDLIWFKD